MEIPGLEEVRDSKEGKVGTVVRIGVGIVVSCCCLQGCVVVRLGRLGTVPWVSFKRQPVRIGLGRLLRSPL